MGPSLQTFTLLLADDHPLARAGVRSILSKTTDIEIVGEAENGDDIKTLIPRLLPNILLLDLKMPGTSPVEIEKWVRLNYPEVVTLVLTAHDRDYYLTGMMDAGVAGYLDKNERGENLIAAIRRAANGEVFFTAHQINRARKWRQEVAPKWEKLTWREREILSLMEQGWSNKAIASHLSITLKTVSYHVSAIFDRLDVESRHQAVSWYRTHFPEESG